jgi:hypothetical protein
VIFPLVTCFLPIKTTNMNEKYTHNSTFLAESEYQVKISLRWTYVGVITCERIFTFTHATMRLTTNMNENYNSNLTFNAESKYELGISLIWTHACVFLREGGGAINYLSSVEKTSWPGAQCSKKSDPPWRSDFGQSLYWKEQTFSNKVSWL